MLKDKNFDSAAAIATSKIAEDGGITSSHIGSSKVLAANIASSVVLDRHLSANLRKGFIPLNLFNMRTRADADIVATALSSATTPTLNVTSSVSGSSKPACLITWSTAVVTPIQFAPIVMPPDYSTVNSSMTLFVRMGRSASTDAARNLNINFTASTAVFSTVTLALSSGTAPFSTSILLTAAGMPGYPGVLNVSMYPGPSSDENVHFYGAWLEYTRNSTA